ncbi:CopG family transcriptional regulator [Gemella sp. ND 6198]|uniref:CopG family transcriptional regulator n=1 Tax=Gemella sp. ND 6198 TaxID=2040624 RepID=UPI000E0CA571|nr:CopG family transcriptional regulator [Gemella sp. ND 6198]AXI27287.1 CopG family transcriptional regulator [Gemella sp. ND 6198]
MKPRKGRPKSDNPLNVDLKVRVTEETNKKLLDYAKKNNLTKVEVIRKGIEIVLKSDK